MLFIVGLFFGSWGGGGGVLNAQLRNALSNRYLFKRNLFRIFRQNSLPLSIINISFKVLWLKKNQMVRNALNVEKEQNHDPLLNEIIL